jgi:hypothetical protein
MQLQAAKKDAEVYVERVEQAKVIGKMQDRKRAVAAAVAAEGATGTGERSGDKRKRGGGEAASAGASLSEGGMEAMRRQFKQRQPLPDRVTAMLHTIAHG